MTRRLTKPLDLDQGYIFNRFHAVMLNRVRAAVSIKYRTGGG